VGVCVKEGTAAESDTIRWVDLAANPLYVLHDFIV
jgi:hypothetical protein